MRQKGPFAARKPVEPFTVVEKRVAHDPRLSNEAKVLYTHLKGFSREGLCFPGQARLAALLRCSRFSVARYAEELVQAGYLRIVRRGHCRTNQYEFVEEAAGVPVETSAGAPADVLDVAPAQHHDVAPAQHHDVAPAQHPYLQDPLRTRSSSSKDGAAAVSALIPLPETPAVSPALDPETLRARDELRTLGVGAPQLDAILASDPSRLTACAAWMPFRLADKKHPVEKPAAVAGWALANPEKVFHRAGDRWIPPPDEGAAKAAARAEAKAKAAAQAVAREHAERQQLDESSRRLKAREAHFGRLSIAEQIDIQVKVLDDKGSTMFVQEWLRRNKGRDPLENSWIRNAVYDECERRHGPAPALPCPAEERS